MGIDIWVVPIKCYYHTSLERRRKWLVEKFQEDPENTLIISKDEESKVVLIDAISSNSNVATLDDYDDFFKIKKYKKVILDEYMTFPFRSKRRLYDILKFVEKIYELFVYTDKIYSEGTRTLFESTIIGKSDFHVLPSDLWEFVKITKLMVWEGDMFEYKKYEEEELKLLVYDTYYDLTTEPRTLFTYSEDVELFNYYSLMRGTNTETRIVAEYLWALKEMEKRGEY